MLYHSANVERIVNVQSMLENVFGREARATEHDAAKQRVVDADVTARGGDASEPSDHTIDERDERQARAPREPPMQHGAERHPHDARRDSARCPRWSTHVRSAGYASPGRNTLCCPGCFVTHRWFEPRGAPPCVLLTACVARGPADIAEPALNPNQPSQSSAPPVTVSGSDDGATVSSRALSAGAV